MSVSRRADEERTPTRPGQILVLEKSGKLVIHDEIADEELFRQLLPPPKPKTKVKEDTTKPPRVRTKQKSDFEEVPDDVFGGAKGKTGGKR